MKVYDVIKAAEEIYVEEITKRKDAAYPGMCWCLKVSAVKGFDFKERNRKGHPSYKDLVDNIPEFNPEFLKATEEVKMAGLDFWWEHHDTESRLKAFQVLKDIYKDSPKEFEY